MKFTLSRKIFVIIFLIIENELYYYLLLQEKNDKLKIQKFYSDANVPFDQTSGNYPGYNNLELNYLYECSKYFKYSENSDKDIVIFAYTERPEKSFFDVFENIIESFRNSVPNALIFCVMPEKDINSNGHKKLEGYGIKVIPFAGYYDYSIVTSRYIAIYDFLRFNSKKYRRVFLSNIDDVYMFNDIFSTFNEDQIIVNKQCFQFESENCNLLFPIDEGWFNDIFINNNNNTDIDLELIKDIGKDKINPQVINGGIIFGGTKKVIEFLRIFIEHINPNKAQLFGYDQVLITLLVNKNKFASIGLQIEQCTHRVCFMPDIRYNSNTTKIIYKENMCSPIVLHKSIPINWKNLK